ncbi:amino acid deaminase/aldolase [Bacillus sp. 1P06AnD]|uniref:amino acid deaminase/aldolase n=1 Tax=Bacillus sp. 1P06AnD TaxID=3132208 RepID=UPI00399FC5F7
MVSQKQYETICKMNLPALFLDLSAFEANCRAIAAQAANKRIRIATKSIRSVDILRRILDSSDVYQGLMCFTASEALFLHEKGFDDLLIGYPSYDREALKKIAAANQNGYRIVTMVDSNEHVLFLSSLAQEMGGLFHICMDMDMSTRFASLHFGVRRSPINTVEQLIELAEACEKMPGLNVMGLMGYEAQIAGVGDAVPNQFFKNKVVSFMKKASLEQIASRRRQAVEACSKIGISLTIVNGGGTGSLRSTREEPVVTEVTVGSGFFSPLLFDYYRHFSYRPSLFFALPVVRKASEDIYTCLGGGYIASGTHGIDKVPEPFYPEGGRLLPLEGAGEVQTPVYYKDAMLAVGEAILFRAAKAGEICERFHEINLLQDDQIVGKCLTYRGEGKCFL